MDLLTEGVYDKGALKAVFMAGGPGSGKSFVAKGLFGSLFAFKRAGIIIAVFFINNKLCV